MSRFARKTLLLSGLLSVASCDKQKGSEERQGQTESASAAERTASTLSCQSQRFALTVDLPEASGATILADKSLLVVADSGRNGAFVRLSPETGEVLSAGQLPLDALASDDLEGVSLMNGRLFAITSSGWMREWSTERGDFQLVEKSYALADYDARELVCESAKSSNCAQNYEGLCLLREAPEPGQCAGFAAAKATGDLLCLELEATGRLRLDPSRSLHVAGPKSLSGCHLDDEGRLWFGSNFFSANAIGFVEGWQRPKDAVITRIGSVGLGFTEAIAVAPGGTVFRLSDTARSPSLLSKYICR